MHQVDNDPQKVVTSVFRASFCHVMEKGKTVDGKEKYMVTMLFPKKETDLKALRAAMKAAAVDKFGENEAKWPKFTQNPIKDGDGKPYDGYAGNWYVYASSDKKPTCVYTNNKEIVNKDEIYSGCYGRAVIRAFGYNKAGKIGISFGLEFFQKVKEGEPFTGRGRAEDFFTPMADENPENFPSSDASESNSIFG